MGPWGARGTERLVCLPGLGQPLPLPAFVDTAGGSAAGAGRCPLLSGLAGPLSPQRQWRGGRGRGQAGSWKAPCKAEGNLPGGPSNWPVPEWAGCGISIILCRGWNVETGSHPLLWQLAGGRDTLPRMEGVGWTPDLSGRSALRPAATPPDPDPQLRPPLPKPETRGLTSKLTLDTFSQSAPAPTGQHRPNNAPQAQVPWGDLPNHTL